MPARALPVLVLYACASTAPLPETEQPQLTELAKPYGQQLRAVVITRLVSPGNRAMVRLETLSGPVYVRYPEHVAPSAFVVDVGPDGDVRAGSTSFDRARDANVLAAIVPGAIREAASNNTVQWIRANPWH